MTENPVRSNNRPADLAPTAPLFTRHFYPLGYVDEGYHLVDIRGPFPAEEIGSGPSQFTRIVVAGLLILWLLLVGSMVRGTRNPAPEMAQPTPSASRKVLARPFAPPIPNTEKPKMAMKPKTPWDELILHAADSELGTNTFCLSTSYKAYSAVPRGPEISCICLLPYRAQPGVYAASTSRPDTRAAQKQPFACDQWLGLDWV